MSNAKKDENGRNTIIAASSSNGTTIVPIKANASNHGLSVDNAATGSDNGNNGGIAMLDENSVPVWIAKASDGTLVEVYGDLSTGKLLINSN